MASHDFTQWTEIQVDERDNREGHPSWGTRLVWYLRGPQGVIQFVLRFDRDGAPQPWDIGFHSPTEIEWATEMDACDLFDGARCWYDGSSLSAENLWEKVLDGGGHEALWTELRERYSHWLGEKASV